MFGVLLLSCGSSTAAEAAVSGLKWVVVKGAAIDQRAMRSQDGAGCLAWAVFPGWGLTSKSVSRICTHRELIWKFTG